MVTSLKAAPVALAALLAAAPAALAETAQRVDSDAREALALTVYAHSPAVISDRRAVTLEKGINRLSVSGLPQGFLADSLMLDLAGAADPRLRGLTLSHEPVSPQGALSRMVGQTINWRRFNPISGSQELRKGKILSATGSVVVEFKDGIEINPDSYPVFDKLPADLSLGTGFTARVEGANRGAAALDMTYQTGGLNWRAGYTLNLSGDERSGRLSGKVALANNTDADFTDARLRLVAGDVATVAPPPQPRALKGARMETMAMAADAAAAPEPRAAHDLHLYDMAGQHDLPRGTTQRLALVDAVSLPLRKRYVLENHVQMHQALISGEVPRQSPRIHLSFRNDGKSGLGRPLPAGVIRIYGSDDGLPLLLGEDHMQHTPEGEKVDLTIGRSFDITARRKQVGFTNTGDRRQFDVAYEVVLKNAKSTGTVVEVVEHIPGEWRVAQENLAHVKRDSATAVWSVPVPAKGEAVLTFRIKGRR